MRLHVRTVLVLAALVGIQSRASADAIPVVIVPRGSHAMVLDGSVGDWRHIAPLVSVDDAAQSRSWCCCVDRTVRRVVRIRPRARRTIALFRGRSARRSDRSDSRSWRQTRMRCWSRSRCPRAIARRPTTDDLPRITGSISRSRAIRRGARRRCPGCDGRGNAAHGRQRLHHRGDDSMACVARSEREPHLACARVSPIRMPTIQAPRDRHRDRERTR